MLSPEEVTGRSNIDIVLSSVNKSAEAAKSTSTTEALNRALSPATIDCCRVAFAAFVWHEGLVKELLETANHLRANPLLFEGSSDSACDTPPVAKRVALIWSHVRETIVSVIANLQLNMSPPDSRQFRLRSLGTFTVAPVSSCSPSLC